MDLSFVILTGAWQAAWDIQCLANIPNMLSSTLCATACSRAGISSSRYPTEAVLYGGTRECMSFTQSFPENFTAVQPMAR